MENKLCLNLAAMPMLFTELNVSEIKLTLVIAYYLKSNNKSVFVNSADTREWLSSYGFKRTPERISNLLSMLVKKGILVREGFGVYSLSPDIISSTQ